MRIKTLLPVLVLLFSSFIALNAQNKTEVDSKGVSVLLQKDKTLKVIDVRTPEEFQNGHIKDAINLNIRDSIAFSKIDKLDRDQKYIVHCRTNHRSGKAVEYMIQHGFKNIYQMMDGFTGWESNNLPIQK